MRPDLMQGISVAMKIIELYQKVQQALDIAAKSTHS